MVQEEPRQPPCNYLVRSHCFTFKINLHRIFTFKAGKLKKQNVIQSYLPLVCLARLRFSSHFSIIWATLPPSTVMTLGLSHMTPWHTSRPSLFSSTLVPGGVFILRLETGLISNAVHEVFPSLRVNFNILGADVDSSLALGADTLRIF